MQFIRKLLGKANFEEQIDGNKVMQDDKRVSQLNKILTTASKDATPRELFGEVDNNFWFWLNTEGYRQNLHLRQILPGLPDEAIQLRFTGAAGDQTLGEAFNAYKIFKKAAETSLQTDTGLITVLDFGCGWGRNIRFFLRDVEPANLWGIDCFSDAIQLCHDTNQWANFKLIDPLPPTAFPDDKFDLVYCYSVFSHLSEDAHKQWLTEFRRILKPGGLLIATTRPREFILMCAEFRKNKDRAEWKRGALRAFLDTKQALADYDSGNFLYDEVGGGGILDPSIYGEACIPKGYVLNRWTDQYEFIDYVDDRKKCNQNVIVVRKQKQT